MRDLIHLYVNGKAYAVQGDAVFRPLTDFLRYDLRLTGTKVVCAEGDCGACTVLIGRLSKGYKNGELEYTAVNGCIQYLYQLDCTHIVTLEGLLDENNQPNSVQQAMMACNGAQCGYCTPGIVVSMCGFFNGQTTDRPATETEIRDCLTGNLCRCTGYEAILKAGTSVAPHEFKKLHALYPTAGMIQTFQSQQSRAVDIQTGAQRFYQPANLADALAFKAQHPNAMIVSGGTDVHVVCNKRHLEPPVLMSLAGVSELSGLTIEDSHLVVGARASLSQLETVVADIFPELAKILDVFGSPQIKQAGTLAGNIANGSPIGDTLPFLFVMDAQVELASQGGSRQVNINQLYTGYRQLAMAPDELITRVRIPLPVEGETLRLYKVSRRQNLDISTFTAAIRMQIENKVMRQVKMAYGGVGPVILRLPKTEAFLEGKPFDDSILNQAGALAQSEITPISDVRGFREYRLQLAANILRKFYWDVETGHTAFLEVTS